MNIVEVHSTKCTPTKALVLSPSLSGAFAWAFKLTPWLSQVHNLRPSSNLRSFASIFLNFGEYSHQRRSLEWRTLPFLRALCNFFLSIFHCVYIRQVNASDDSFIFIYPYYIERDSIGLCQTVTLYALVSDVPAVKKKTHTKKFEDFMQLRFWLYRWFSVDYLREVKVDWKPTD